MQFTAARGEIVERRNYLGFDFGASSGRAMLGSFDGGRMELREIHRFDNEPVMLCGQLVWDLPRLVFEMKRALNALSRAGVQVSGIGIDTWGVDFGLLDARGRLLALPVHYRDARTEGVMDEAFAAVSREELFGLTGIAFNSFNTLFQLLAMKRDRDPALDAAQTLLFMPDLLAYCLTGVKGVEYTIASTSQLLDPERRDWLDAVFDRFGLPRHLTLPVDRPGAPRGTLLPQIARECGVGEIPVFAVGGHDTASAVAAVPAQKDGFAYLSSGTWSLLGVEIPQPMCTQAVLDAGYTNEGGVDGSIRLLRNIMGLWIIQECKREWDRRGEEAGYGELVELAKRAPAFKAVLDVDDDSFLAPGDMPARVQGYCRRTGQSVPEGRGEIARVIYESLALKYRWAIERLEGDILGRRIAGLNVVGGGSKNDMLNQFTADALGREVVAGPSEATVIGNLLVQAAADGAVSDLRAGREVAARSFPTRTFQPAGTGAWDDAYRRYLELMNRR